MWTICQNFARSLDRIRSFLMSTIEAMESIVTTVITKGVSDGNLYRYLVITAIRTIRKMKKTADSKRVVIGRFLDFILRITRNAL